VRERGSARYTARRFVYASSRTNEAGLFPLPVAEAKRLKTWLAFPERFSALDPCVGDGVAFAHLLREVTAHRYDIEMTQTGAEQAKALGIETLQANAMNVRCQPEAVSLPRAS
jgi:hypothetical protein